MRRMLTIAGWGLLSLIALIALAAALLFATPPGHDFLKGVVEDRLAAATGSEAHIGGLAGRLPGHVVLTDVELSHDGKLWLETQAIVLHWRPFALLSGKISIDSLAVSGVDLLRLPPEQEQAPKDGPVRAPINLPKDLPNISIRNFVFGDVRVAEAVAGQPVLLDGAGYLRAGGGLLKLRLDASSQNDTDVINAMLHFDPGADYGAMDVIIASEAEGALASILGVGGPAFLEIKGQAPLADFVANLDGDLGGYGNIDARLASDLTTPKTVVDVDAALTLGEKLAGVADFIGDEVSINATVRDDGDVLIVLDSLSAPAGTVSGEIELINRNGRLDEAKAALDITVSKTQHLASIREQLGARITLIAEAAYARDAYDLTARFSSPRLEGSIVNGRTNLQDSFSGRVDLSAAPQSLPAPFDGGANLTTDVALADDGRAVFDGLRLTLPDGSVLSGDGAFLLDEQLIDFTGDLSLSPEFVSRLIEDLVVEEAVAARISASGELEDFAVEINAEAPAARLNEATIPASEIKARLVGLPRSPSAAISAEPIDKAGELILRMRLAEDGAIRVSRLQVESPNFTLEGSGAWRDQTLAVDIAYSGKEGAEPYPGFLLSGSLTAKGEIGRGAEANVLKVRADDLRSGEIGLGALSLDASGSPENIRFTLNAAAAQIPALGVFEALTAEGAADLSGDPSIRIESLAGRRMGVRFSLASAATIVFSEGVQAQNVRLRYGTEGELALDGRLSADRWQAEVQATNFPAPQANIIADITLSLDTAEETPARGEFSLTPLLAAGESLTVNGDLLWDGETLRLSDAEGTAFDFNVAIPLALNRAPDLSIETEGELSGQVAFEGGAGELAAFLPATLRTIEGDVGAQLDISGTLESPTLKGRLTLSDGAYTEPVSGLTLTRITLEADATSSGAATIIEFAMGAGGVGQEKQTITLSGDLQLGPDAAVNATLALDDAVLSAGPVTQATASGEIEIHGPLASATAAGAVTIDELNARIVTPETAGLVDITVVAADGETPNAKTSEPEAQRLPISFAIEVSADDRIFIRGRGLESEWRANVNLKGDAQKPVVIGAVELRRGTLDFASRRFTFTRGKISFDRLTQNDPMLDLRAEYDTDGGVTAAIIVQGRASSPEISLTSSPVLPAEDVMALILFGEPATELSALESLQVAEALAQLTGVGPFGDGGGITGIAREALGLDMLNLSLDSDAGATSLEIGKYVAEGLFISAKQDARGESGSVTVEYEITDSISVETELQQDGDQTVSANWKRDF